MSIRNPANCVTGLFKIEESRTVHGIKKKPKAEPAAKIDLYPWDASKNRIAIKITNTLKPTSSAPFNEHRNKSSFNVL